MGGPFWRGMLNVEFGGPNVVSFLMWFHVRPNLELRLRPPRVLLKSRRRRRCQPHHAVWKSRHRGPSTMDGVHIHGGRDSLRPLWSNIYIYITRNARLRFRLITNKDSACVEGSWRPPMMC